MSAARSVPAAVDTAAPRGGAAVDRIGKLWSALPISPTIVMPTTMLVVMATLWWPFASSTGMAWDTTLVYASETSSFWEGFVYRHDPLRVYTSVFYQLGYQLSALVGIDGDYLGYYIVYGLLWLGRGVLTYLILRRLFPQYVLFPFLASILVLVHASDHALKMIGQTNQFGMIFWMLLALYLLLVAMTANPRYRVLPITGSVLATYMCLWSYESPLFVLLVAPLLFLAAQRDRRAALLSVAVFYVLPLRYAYLHLERHRENVPTYQSAVARDDWALSGLVSDFVFNIRASLEFWDWGEWAAEPRAANTALLLSMTAAFAVFAAGAALILHSRSANRPLLPSGRRAFVLLIAGVILLSASFPAYLASVYARDLWRTQFLSGVGAAIAIAAALALGAWLMQRPVVGATLATAAVAIVAFFGTGAAYRAGQNQHDTWELQRRAIAAMLDVAPRVRPGTVVIVTGIPKTADPFGHNMWFDHAVRLAYPRVRVAGMFVYDTGEPSVGANMKLVDGRWVQTPSVSTSLITDAPVSQTLVVRVDRAGHGRLLNHLPRAFAGTSRYRLDPQAVVAGTEPSPVARRRYDLSR